MKALILVGGLGTRLRPLSVNLAKAMMPVVNKPFMARVMEHLASHGIDEVILTRGHLAAQMEDYFGDGCKFNLKINYIVENKPLGTAGGIKNCQRLLTETFFVLNGDVFSTFDLTSMFKAHRDKGAVATIALTPVDNPAAFGLVETEPDGRIRRFVEKPRPEEVTTDLINAGCYILEPEVLDYIKPDTNTSIERDTFQKLLADRRPFYAVANRSAYWIDMGKTDKYFQFNRDVLNGRCQCVSTPPAGVEVGNNTAVDASAAITGNVTIGRGCRIGAGVEIAGPAVVGDDCLLEAGTHITNSIIWSDVKIGEGAVITDSIIADGCRISPYNRITASALADGVSTPPDMTLTASQVWPGTILSN